MSRPTRYPPRFRAHAVASVALARPRHSSTWAAIKAVAASLAISTETLRTWVRQAESSGGATGPADTRGHQTEIRRLNRENADLRQALDLLRATDGAAMAPPPAGPRGRRSPNSPRRARTRSAATPNKANNSSYTPSAIEMSTARNTGSATNPVRATKLTGQFIRGLSAPPATTLTIHPHTSDHGVPRNSTQPPNPDPDHPTR